MAKKNFTTRFDPLIRKLAEKVAALERRSLTSIMEVSIVEYAAKRGIQLEKETRSEPKSEIWTP